MIADDEVDQKDEAREDARGQPGRINKEEPSPNATLNDQTCEVVKDMVVEDIVRLKAPSVDCAVVKGESESGAGGVERVDGGAVEQEVPGAIRGSTRLSGSFLRPSSKVMGFKFGIA